MKDLQRLNILYAEDNEDERFMLNALLGFSDIDVIFAGGTAEAFQLAHHTNFDLYLLDSRFPVGSGLELCRQLRHFAPHTPIVFYSGDAHQNDMQKGLAAGADAYITKPDSDNIATTLFSLVRNHRNRIRSMEA
jgi:CheY-like chemotaxis protein